MSDNAHASASKATVAQKGNSVKIEKAGVAVDGETESACPGKLSLKDNTKNPDNGKSLSEDSTVYSYDFLVSLPDMAVIEMPSLSDVKTGDKIDQQKAIEIGLKTRLRLDVRSPTQSALLRTDRPAERSA